MGMKSLYVYLPIICLTLVALTGLADAQSKGRLVEFEIPDGPLAVPLEIVEIHVGYLKMSSGQISAGSDWLKDLKITVKNISGKTISRMILSALVHGEGSDIWRFRINFRYYEQTSPFPRLHYSDVKPGAVLKPEESVVIGLDPRSVDDLMRRFSEHNIFGTDRAVIEFSHIMFDDNTGYARGRKICPVPGRTGTTFSVGGNAACPSN
jgi:hypothetical protein